jgi:hypothetical protein
MNNRVKKSPLELIKERYAAICRRVDVLPHSSEIDEIDSEINIAGQSMALAEEKGDLESSADIKKADTYLDKAEKLVEKLEYKQTEAGIKIIAVSDKLVDIFNGLNKLKEKDKKSDKTGEVMTIHRKSGELINQAKKDYQNGKRDEIIAFLSSVENDLNTAKELLAEFK